MQLCDFADTMVKPMPGNWRFIQLPGIGGAIVSAKCGYVKKPPFFGGSVEIFRVLCEKYYTVLDMPASRSGNLGNWYPTVFFSNDFYPVRKL